MISLTLEHWVTQQLTAKWIFSWIEILIYTLDDALKEMTSACTNMKWNDIWFSISCKTRFWWVCTVNTYQILISQSRTQPPDVFLKLFPMGSMAIYAIKILLSRFQGYKEWQNLSYNYYSISSLIHLQLVSKLLLRQPPQKSTLWNLLHRGFNTMTSISPIFLDPYSVWIFLYPSPKHFCHF